MRKKFFSRLKLPPFPLFLEKSLSFWGSIVLVPIILWGIFLRLNALPIASLWMDEGYSFLAAQTFQNTGGITLETGFEYGKNSILFHALQAESMNLFGTSEWALRLPSFVFGVLLLFFSFWGTRKALPKSLLPFFFSAAISLSSWEIVWSVQGRMYQMLQTLFLVSLYFLWKFFIAPPKKNVSTEIFFFLFFALCTSFVHPFGSILFPLFFLVWGIRKIRMGFFSSSHKLRNIALFLFPILLFASWKFDFLLFLFGNGISSSFLYQSRFLVEQHGIVLMSGYVSALILFWKGDKKQRQNFAFLLTTFFIPFLIIGLFVPAVNYRYLFPLFPILLLMGFLWIPIAEKKWGYIISTGIALLQCGMLASEWRVLPYAPYALEADQEHDGYRFYTPQPDFRSAFLFLKNTKKTGEILVTPYPEIARFYGVNADATFLFDWNERANEWKDIQRARYLNLPHIASEEELETLLRTKSGFVLLDSFALERMPLEAAGFLEANAKRISPFPGEQGVTGDSRLLLFRFGSQESPQ